MKLTELYAKRKELIEKSNNITDDMSAKDIHAITADLSKVNANISLEEAKEEDVKAKADKDIMDGIMSPEGKEVKDKDVRGTQAYTDGFYNYIRGEAITSEQRQVMGSISKAGVPVPKSFENKLIVALEEANLMRQLGTVMKTNSDKDIPIVATVGSADWTDENGSFNESDDTFDVVTIKAWKLTRIIKVSEEILEDVTFDLEGWLVESFTEAISVPEEVAMFVGDGVDRPTGATITAQVGVTSASTSAITVDEIVDLYYSLKRKFRKKATWVMNDETIKIIRKLKDNDDNYIWAKGLSDEPDTILGRPVESTDAMPTLTAGEVIILFGDFKYYRIGDRSKRIFQRLDELYSAEGQVGFRGYERVDGILTMPKAIKSLKILEA